MRISKLVIIVFFVGLTGFNLSSTFDFRNPSITVSSEIIEETSQGKILILSLSLCSSDNLESFSIQPDVEGLNQDSELQYVFNNTTKQASVNYYFSAPDNLDKVNLTMKLKDAAKESTKIKEVRIN